MGSTERKFPNNGNIANVKQETGLKTSTLEKLWSLTDLYGQG